MPHTNDKRRSFDKIQITAAARQALMAADAHYYSWPAEQQERFRATMDEDTRTKIRRILLDRLLSIQCSDENVDETWDDVPLPTLNILNWAKLLTSGVGEDYLYLNESMAEGKSLLDFTTLYDYDYSDHLFQEESRHKHASNYQGADYYAYRHPSWARLLINDRLYYATFTSLASHFIDEIEEAGNDLIKQLIPHQYIEGEDNGKPVSNEGNEGNGGFLWDMRIDANGQEGQLDELKSRWYSYQQARWLSLSKVNAKSPTAVYTQDKDWDDDAYRFFIFNNEAALKKIRWRHFLSDCKPLMGSYSMVASQLEQEVNSAKIFLTENHQDIQANVDPNVIKLRKKRKIIMTAGALDDFDKMSREDEPQE
ncbi:MAG: hypothetical protein COB30_011735 [Ectothiorhodospiraceae bacterium]|nr:hypothetical protein [Ectothiorhodospiraceae bacterium]